MSSRTRYLRFDLHEFREIKHWKPERIGVLMLLIEMVWRRQLPLPETIEGFEKGEVQRQLGLDPRTLRPHYDQDMLQAVRALTMQRTPITEAIRELVYESTGGICLYCNIPVARDDFHVAHRKAVTRGGLNNESNFAPAHPSCNQAAGAHE